MCMGWGYPSPLPPPSLSPPCDTPGCVGARTIIPQADQLVKKKIEEISNKNKQS